MINYEQVYIDVNGKLENLKYLFNENKHIDIWLWFYKSIQDEHIQQKEDIHFNWKHVCRMVDLIKRLDIPVEYRDTDSIKQSRTIPFPKGTKNENNKQL